MASATATLGNVPNPERTESKGFISAAILIGETGIGTCIGFRLEVLLVL
jgi:hypothetical protein